MNEPVNTNGLSVGTQVFIPLAFLAKSPDNVRKMPHSEASIEAYAASIAAKGILQNLVVAPEFDYDGTETGMYFVTIGEGRRLAQLRRAERGDIDMSEPIPCVIRLADDAMEVSLDENVTRENMHPADQFEAFRALNEERRMSAEDIAARFGISAKTVKQRLRLGAVSPNLMQAYRDDQLTLDQLMAFCITEDHARQESAFARLNGHQREAYHIRRLLTETNVRADDRRALFVGAETYINAGGHITRDLFTEDGGGYFEDAGLLDALVLQRLTAIATAIQGAEGWKWAEAYLDFPYGNGMGRAYPKTVALSEEDTLALSAAQNDLMALSDEYADADEIPDAVDVKMTELEIEIGRLQNLTTSYEPEDLARGGVIVSLLHDGRAKIERGLIRLANLVTEAKPDTMVAEGGDGGEFRDDQDADASCGDEDNEPEKPLSDLLIRDLTTHRTFAMRLALGEQPELATRALLHTLVLDLFYRYASGGCLDISATSASINQYAEGVDDSPTAQAVQARHDAWHSAMPDEPDDLWAYILAMEPETLGALLAHCVGQTIDAVQQPHSQQSGMPIAAGRLAANLLLDMTEHWRPTARSYFGRVTKSHIVAAVREAVGEEAAEHMAHFKKSEMAEVAEQLVEGTGWLPAALRTAAMRGDPVADAEEADGLEKRPLAEAAE
jgi:ParB family chromosome partitioning protein